MHISLLGGTGRTGTLVAAEALRRGHTVRALVRDPSRLGELAGRVEVLRGDATDPASLRALVADADVLVSALGPTKGQADLHSRVATTLAVVLSETGPCRFVGVSGAGIDVPGDLKSRRDRVVSKLIQTFGGKAVQDKSREYAVWAATDLEWTLVRPPRLVDGPASAGALEHDAHASARSTRMRRPDLARMLIDVVEQGRYVRQAPLVATPKA